MGAWGLALRGAVLMAGFFVLQAQSCSGNVGNTVTGPFTFRVSTGANDLQADGQSSTPTVTADGRYVAFASQANDLASQPSGFREIFVKDRQTGLVSNISRMASAAGPADCNSPFISSDGQWVVFTSTANYNGPVQTTANVFFSTFPPGNLPSPVLAIQPNFDVVNPSIARAGASLWVVFQTGASNIPLLTNPSPGQSQIYARDLLFLGVTTYFLVSHSTASSSTFPNAFSRNPVISGDGSTVAFTSAASDIIAAGSSTELVYVGTPTAGAVTLVSTASGAPVANANGVCLKPAITTNGNLVAFTNEATNLVAGSTGHDVVVRNISAQTTTLAATGVLSLSGLPGNIGFPLGISDDGRFIAYTLRADSQIYIRDMLGGTTLGSAGQTGAAGNAVSLGALLSPDGQWLFWQSASDNLVLEDTNGAVDVFGRGPLH
jgi:Tol biopolymer transport system component